MPGKIVLVGAGPGDPGLLTVRGRGWLERADVVVYDYLANPVLLELAPPHAELHLVGKHGGGPRVEQEEIHRLMIEYARQDKIVVRLKGGDPFLFGRGGEEMQAAIDAGIDIEVVPGVTAALAVPAYAGVPLTHRDLASAVSFVAGYEYQDKDHPSVRWERLVDDGHTLVILMTQRQLRRNMEKLLAAGRDPATPVAVIESGTRANQRCVVATIANVAERAEQAGIRPPALAVVGKVVHLRERLAWYERKPLFGRRIVVTRPRQSAARLVERLEEEGAEVLPFPTIEIAPPTSYAALDEALQRPSDFDWLVFTSANGVRAFVRRLCELKLDLRTWHNARIAAIGTETAAELERLALRVDVVPEDFRAEGLAAALSEQDLAGKTILLARAEEARSVLPETLLRRGARVTEVAAYRSVLPARIPHGPYVLDALARGGVDLVVFTSSSTVRNFVRLLTEHGVEPTGLEAAVIGPITAETARALGFEVVVQPGRYVVEALADAIVEHLGRRKVG